MNTTTHRWSPTNPAPRRSRLALGVCTLALATSYALPVDRAAAQEIQITGPLAGQPAVRQMRQHRVDRVQIVPTLGYTLQDDFARSLMLGLEANVHFNDFLGIGVWGALANFGNAFQINTDLTSQVIDNGDTISRNRLSMPSPQGFGDQVARLQGVTSLHAVFAPLRGKVSLFQGLFVDADFYVLAGLALAFVQERADINANQATACASDANGAPADPAGCAATQTARKDRVAPAPMLGVGLNVYFNDFLGLAIQWRAFPFNMNPAGTDEAGAPQSASVSAPDGQINSTDERFYFHQMFNIGLIISLPPEVNITD